MFFIREISILMHPAGERASVGKCKVLIIRGQVSEISQDESRYLSDKERAEGYRLACLTKVFGDVEVAIKSYIEGAQIMSSGIEYSVDISPRINKRFVQLDLPTVEDQRDDLKRLGCRRNGRDDRTSPFS